MDWQMDLQTNIFRAVSETTLPCTRGDARGSNIQEKRESPSRDHGTDRTHGHEPDCYRTDDCSHNTDCNHNACCDHCNSNYNSSDLSSAGNNLNDKSNDGNDDRDNFNNGDI